MLVKISSEGNGSPPYWYAKYLNKNFEVKEITGSDRGNGFSNQQYETVEIIPEFMCTGIINKSDALILDSSLI